MPFIFVVAIVVVVRHVLLFNDVLQSTFNKVVINFSLTLKKEKEKIKISLREKNKIKNEMEKERKKDEKNI